MLSSGGISVVLGPVITVVSVLSAVAIYLLELFVAFLQAYLFTFLTALFISQMVTHEHDDKEHDSEDEAAHHGHPVVAEIGDAHVASKTHQM